MKDDERVKSVEALKKEIKVYTKLRQLKETSNFEDYLEFLGQSAAQQMINIFVGKVKTYEEFLAVRGEVVAKMYILQELGGAKTVEIALLNNLKQYTNPQQPE